MSRGKKDIKNFFKKIKKPIDKQNKICYNKYIKGKKKTKAKRKNKNKKMLDKPLKKCYNKYVKNKTI